MWENPDWLSQGKILGGELFFVQSLKKGHVDDLRGFMEVVFNEWIGEWRNYAKVAEVLAFRFSELSFVIRS